MLPDIIRESHLISSNRGKNDHISLPTLKGIHSGHLHATSPASKSHRFTSHMRLLLVATDTWCILYIKYVHILSVSLPETILLMHSKSICITYLLCCFRRVCILYIWALYSVMTPICSSFSPPTTVSQSTREQTNTASLSL